MKRGSLESVRKTRNSVGAQHPPRGVFLMVCEYGTDICDTWSGVMALPTALIGSLDDLLAIKDQLTSGQVTLRDRAFDPAQKQHQAHVKKNHVAAPAGSTGGSSSQLAGLKRETASAGPKKKGRAAAGSFLVEPTQLRGMRMTTVSSCTLTEARAKHEVAVEIVQHPWRRGLWRVGTARGRAGGGTGQVVQASTTNP